MTGDHALQVGGAIFLVKNSHLNGRGAYHHICPCLSQTVAILARHVKGRGVSVVFEHAHPQPTGLQLWDQLLQEGRFAGARFSHQRDH